MSIDDEENLHKTYYDEEGYFVEEVPEGDLPDCMNNKHHFLKSNVMEEAGHKICLICGKVFVAGKDLK